MYLIIVLSDKLIRYMPEPVDIFDLFSNVKALDTLDVAGITTAAQVFPQFKGIDGLTCK